MLFVPVWDLNPLKRVRFQYVTIGIIIVNIIIYFTFETNLVFHSAQLVLDTFSLRPRDVAPFQSLLHHASAPFRLVTYMFLHGSAWHLFGNMVFLFVFGDNVEDAMGHARFALFYVLCGACAALIHSQITAAPDLSLIGASGAVSGVIGAYFVLHPNIRVWVLLPNLPFVPLRFSAAFVIGIWIVYQIASAVYLAKDATAWWAHIGGFFIGILLVTVMKRPGVKLFDAETGV
jgi:membrane associated rhomboid family serine protease